jgi:hypothetical protein
LHSAYIHHLSGEFGVEEVAAALDRCEAMIGSVELGRPVASAGRLVEADHKWSRVAGPQHQIVG